MKLIKVIGFLLFTLVLPSSAFSGAVLPTYRIQYSPANPTVGQAVTFTLLYQDYNCEVESVIPDAVNNIGNLLPFPANYVYTAPGVYHVALDVEFDPNLPECFPAVRNTKGNSRALESNFDFGPVGGPFVPAVMQGEIFCSPITIAAAPGPIPTMSQWGFLILILSSAVIGVVFMTSRTKIKA